MGIMWALLRHTGSRLASESMDRLRRRSRAAGLRMLRLTGAATASYAVALALSPNSRPVLAPLTALLVVQVTLFSIVRSSAQRVVSVVLGVVVAVFFSEVVGLTWWSLGLLIATAIAIGMLLRLGDHLLEVPISAMLVLAVGGAETVATGRIVETLIGAGVGALVNVVFPPAVQTRSAGAAVEALAADLARLLESAGADLAEGVTETQAGQWLEDARSLTRDVPQIHREVLQAQESRRLNVRALGTRDAAASLRGGLDALENSAVAVRSMFRSVLDGVRTHPRAESELAEELRLAFSVLLHDLATAVRSFGRLVRAEARAMPGEEEAELAEALDALREARARATELLLVDPRDDVALWELNSAMLSTVERLLRELDVEQHVRLREQSAGLRRSGQAAARVRTTTRHIVDRPRASLRRRTGPG